MLRIEGELDLPEVSRRVLDLLIAEEDEGILLEERRLEFREEPRAPEGEITVPPPSPSALVGVEEAAEPLPSQVLAPEELKPVGWEPEVPLPGEYPLNRGLSSGSQHSCCRQHPVIQLAEGRTL